MSKSTWEPEWELPDDLKTAFDNGTMSEYIVSSSDEDEDEAEEDERDEEEDEDAGHYNTAEGGR